MSAKLPFGGTYRRLTMTLPTTDPTTYVMPVSVNCPNLLLWLVGSERIYVRPYLTYKHAIKILMRN